MQSDLTGLKFNRLTVLNFSYSKYRQRFWLCKCDCGSSKEVFASTNWLKFGKIKSCGCLKLEFLKKGCKEGDACRNSVIHNYKLGAKRRNLEWNLSKTECIELLQSNCQYCGIEPKQVFKRKGCTSSYVYNGIDRLDSCKGYTSDNCVPCCKDCNRAKWQMTIEEFKDWLKRICSNMNIK